MQAARDAEKDAKVKLMDFLNNSVADVSKSSPTWNGTTTLSPNGEQQDTVQGLLGDRETVSGSDYL